MPELIPYSNPAVVESRHRWLDPGAHWEQLQQQGDVQARLNADAWILDSRTSASVPVESRETFRGHPILTLEELAADFPYPPEPAEDDD